MYLYMVAGRLGVYIPNLIGCVSVSTSVYNYWNWIFSQIKNIIVVSEKKK